MAPERTLWLMDRGRLRMSLCAAGADERRRNDLNDGEIQMIFRTLGAAAILLLGNSLTQAAFNADDVAAQLASDGYTRIEIKVGQTFAKVEAIKGTTKIEVTYDIASGDVTKSETEPVDANDDTTPGVEIRDDNIGGGGDDDGPNQDVNDDHGGGNDDGPNHHIGDDNSAGDGDDHDLNDDRGGNSGSGDDDDGDDDHSGSGHGDDDGDNSGGDDD